MVDAPFTAYRDTPNKSPRQDVARRGVILHHAAMTSLSGLRSLAMGGKQVSASAIVKDDQAEQLMADAYRPWSVGSAYWDSAMRSVETCNESTNGWSVSDASHWTLARLVAFWSENEGWWPHRDGHPTTWTVIGHRELFSIHGASYATACPGGMDLALVTERAQALRRAGTAGLDAKKIPKENKMAKLYLDKSDGKVWALNVDTGFEYHVPDEAYLDLVVGHGIFETWPPNSGASTARGKLGQYAEKEHNIIVYLRELCAVGRRAA